MQSRDENDEEDEVISKAYWCAYYVALSGYLTGEAGDWAGYCGPCQEVGK